MSPQDWVDLYKTGYVNLHYLISSLPSVSARTNLEYRVTRWRKEGNAGVPDRETLKYLWHQTLDLYALACHHPVRLGPSHCYLCSASQLTQLCAKT